MYFCAEIKTYLLLHYMSVNLSLAPFLGITSKIYRNTFSRHFQGLDQVYAPFISGVHPERANISKFSDVLPFDENMVATIPQFISTDAQEVLAVAKVLKEEGYTRINWNMGCPFSRLANKKRGCGILPYPDEISRMLDVVMPSIPLELTIKTRLGYYQVTELPKVIEIFNRYPLKELIIHPRTGTQLYTGNTHLDQFAYCLSLSKIPVTFNGDIYHSDRYKELQLLFPSVTSWMLGRGALINPFLASQIKGIEPDQDQKRKTIIAFHQEYFSRQQENASNQRKMLGQMKAIWYYMSGLFSNGKQFFDAMKICQDSQSYLNFAHELLQQPFATNDEIEYHWMNNLKHVSTNTVSDVTHNKAVN